MRQHREHAFAGFTSRYHIDRLVWYHIFGDIRDAIAREKQLKGWRREKKIHLIESENPTWQDLSEEWGKPITLKDIVRGPVGNRRSFAPAAQAPPALRMTIRISRRSLFG